MKIAMIGNFGPSHSSENHWRQTLENMGHEVIQFQENACTAEWILAQVKQDQPDLLWWTRTWGLKGNGHRLLHDLPCTSMAYHLDLYAPIPRGKSVRTDPWWRCDFVFTPDGGSNEFWERHGINHHYVRPGVFDRECYLQPVYDAKQTVAFVGSYNYHAEWSYRPKLIDWLKKTYGGRFTHIGHGNNLREHKLNVFYASTKVVVGDSLCMNFTHPYYWSDRVYETLGRGGFLIHPRIIGMEDELKDGEHLVYYTFGDFDELKSKIDYYLKHNEEREKIRKTGHEYVKANCTYVQRITQALEIVKGNVT